MNDCPSCGRELAKDMMFCPYCGSKIQPESSSAEASGPEQVVGTIPLAVAREGSEEGRMFTLVITNSHLIIAKITEGDTIKVRKASDSILFGGAVLEPERHRKALGAYSRRYISMDPHTIVGESSGNDFQKLADVKGIRISSEEGAEGNQFYLLAFETRIGVKKFLIPNDKDSRDLLIATFGEKVHW
ncbi:MAG: zinc-ribbon domain-containing protein [Methanomassiliicoccales archaeon]|jgi:hypothetical protein